MRVSFIIGFILICISSLAAQGTNGIPSPFDSVKVALDTTKTGRTPSIADTARVDSAKRDSVFAAKDSSDSGIDSVVNYTATDSVVYSISTRYMSMYSKGDVKYRDMRLTADRIDVNWTTSVLNAFPYPDSLRKKDTASAKMAKGRDSTKLKKQGQPVMKDGKEEYHGTALAYNFKTKKGKIQVGETTLDQGYYHGDDIKKVGSDVLFIEDGRYTTCDLPDPHYYFFAPRMKVLMQDKVVAEPVYLYIADVPIFALPFAVFPNKGGRRSGIVAPAYGEDNRGRYLRHTGYYFALSDYMDLKTTVDLYTKGGWTGDLLYNYVKQYDFKGFLTGQYSKIIVGEDNDPDRTRSSQFQVHVNHSQTINPEMSLSGDFTFASLNSYLNTLNLAQALNQTIASNASLSKSWDGTPNSVSLSVSRTQNLQDGSNDLVLPSVRFNHSQSYPFRHDQSYDEGAADLRWYENIGLSYGASGLSHYQRINKVLKVKSDTTTKLLDLKSFETDRSIALDQNFSLLIAPKLGYFTISPSFNYSDQRGYTNNDVPITNGDSTDAAYVNQQAWSRVGTISTGVSIDTRLYGIIQPNMLGIDAFRHTLSPSLSLTYTKQIIGENLPPKAMSLGFNLGNVFEMKTKAPEGKDPTRITLLNLGTGISYNFAADSLQFSNIPVNFRTGIGDLLSIDGGAVYDLYQLSNDGGSYHSVNKFEMSNGRFARLKSFGFSFSTQLSGKADKSRQNAGADTTNTHNVKSGYVGLYENEEPDFSIPWNLSLGLQYSETKDPPTPAKSVNVHGDLGFAITQNWKVTASGSYDVLNKQFAAPAINVSRDLHCWLLNFSWVPTGSYRHYQFEIRVKAPQLQDIKLTKSGADNDLR